MKKAISAIIATIVMGAALPVLAADSAPVLNMNVRFMATTDNNVTGTTILPAENRMSLHTVELTAKQEVDNIGGYLQYRIADQSYTAPLGKAASESYPVEAKAYYTSGAFKVSGGLQFVPFGIYKWNNLYNPFLDIPGKMGQIWDADWGILGTYDAKPLLIDLGYWTNAGETLGRETAEKNTYTGRIGYNFLSNLNAGFSYLNGKVDRNADAVALTTRKEWALDSTWGIIPNLQLSGQYVDYSLGDTEIAKADGNYGAIQLKYDIVKVPSPLNRITPVLQYSWNDVKNGVKTKNYQEELWIKAGKNLDVFFQYAQEKVPTVDTDKKGVIAVKYSFQ
ncbi:MAG: hypothetical protein WCX65_00765 [bacterium]